MPIVDSQHQGPRSRLGAQGTGDVLKQAEQVGGSGRQREDLGERTEGNPGGAARALHAQHAASLLSEPVQRLPGNPRLADSGAADKNDPGPAGRVGCRDVAELALTPEIGQSAVTGSNS